MATLLRPATLASSSGTRSLVSQPAIREPAVASTSYAQQQWQSCTPAHRTSPPRPQPVSAHRAQHTANFRMRALDPGSASTGISPELKDALDKFINQHPVVLFMKGTKQFPQCGFSNTCVQILNMMQVPYETVNILEDELLRSGMKEYSQWPTFPQVYIGGEFFGGCDIMIESFQKGELPEILEAAALS